MLTQVTQSTVRMFLQDYDSAPDGVGLYTKLNQGFDSLKSALVFRSRYYNNMYWGAIYDIYGNTLKILNEGDYS